MLTLTITTSTKLASLSLYNKDNLVANININVARTHSTYIVDEVNSLFLWTNSNISYVENIIISVGPGSFTGIRIAISLIKGMYAHSDVKIYVVNELDALAYQAYLLNQNKVISVIDANKEKIYYGKYIDNKIQDDYKVSNLDEIINISKNENYTLIGDAIINYSQKIKENNIKVLANMYQYINANVFYEMYKNNLLKQVDIFNLVPNYLEKSQAEKEKNGNI